METLERALARILEHAGESLCVATPLGLGKPNKLLNALYAHVKATPSKRLTILTALSLGLPRGKSDLESRFLKTFCSRHFGSDYPELAYVLDAQSGALPDNIEIIEFYMQSGAWLSNARMQRHYNSLNYTHVAREVARRAPNVLALLVAERDGQYSLACNPDTAFDTLDAIAEAGGNRPLVVGCVHPELPFMPNDAAVAADFFDVVVEPAAHQHKLFALPREPVLPSEHALGVMASGLVRDGGALQIGIGALSDALVYATLQRQSQNAAYQSLYQALSPASAVTAQAIGGLGRFEKMLYGASEMVMDGFMHLVEAGIVSRAVYDELAIEQAIDAGLLDVSQPSTDCIARMRDGRLLSARPDAAQMAALARHGVLPEGMQIDGLELVFVDGLRVPFDLDHAVTRQALMARSTALCLRDGHILSGAFFLGSRHLYDWLRQLPPARLAQINMTRVSHINQLYGGREALDLAQRDDARFFNTTMIVTGLGAAASETLGDGRVVSGVGGQYNFVAMAHALPRGRSILLLRASRGGDDSAQSNIVWNYPQLTIPRHLRDLVVTEYGIADLRGRTDEECVIALVQVMDAQFQPGFVATAQAVGKLRRDFQIPDAARTNTARRLSDTLKRSTLSFPTFPFGHDFDEQEWQLIQALKSLKTATSTWQGKLAAVLGSLGVGAASPTQQALLSRMALDKPKNLGERLSQKLLLKALAVQATIAKG